MTGKALSHWVGLTGKVIPFFSREIFALPKHDWLWRSDKGANDETHHVNSPFAQ